MERPDPVIPGQRFGRLTTLFEQRDHLRKGHHFWTCRCDCGTERLVYVGSLRSGRSQSCGCLKSEVSVALRTTHGHAGAIKPPEYRAWNSMRERCLNPNIKHYPDYGGRGIRICPEWDDFARFYADVGPRPSPQHSIDRIDNNGNYEPENVKWSTKIEQSKNRRSNHPITFDGRTMLLSEWAQELGCPPTTLSQRLKRGTPLERALTKGDLRATRSSVVRIRIPVAR